MNIHNTRNHTETYVTMKNHMQSYLIVYAHDRTHTRIEYTILISIWFNGNTKLSPSNKIKTSQLSACRRNPHAMSGAAQGSVVLLPGCPDLLEWGYEAVLQVFGLSGGEPRFYQSGRRVTQSREGRQWPAAQLAVRDCQSDMSAHRCGTVGYLGHLPCAIWIEWSARGCSIPRSHHDSDHLCAHGRWLSYHFHWEASRSVVQCHGRCLRCCDLSMVSAAVNFCQGGCEASWFGNCLRC